jgi:hypothetical protein
MEQRTAKDPKFLGQRPAGLLDAYGEDIFRHKMKTPHPKKGEGPFPVTVIGVPACTANLLSHRKIKIPLTFFV